MSKLYNSALPRKMNYSITPESNYSFIRLEIAKDISDYCAKPLLLSLSQMNKDIVRFIMTDRAAKGLE